jgi:GNAT superfamily N-acetyltransferase
MSSRKMPILITRLDEIDRPEWERLFRGYLTFYERSLETEALDRAWGAFMRDEILHARVARLDGRPVGIVHFLVHASTSTADVCYLQDLYTEPEARGHGVARALIAAVVEFAQARECSRVYWATSESNATARRLYDRVATNRGVVIYQISL